MKNRSHEKKNRGYIKKFNVERNLQTPAATSAAGDTDARKYYPKQNIQRIT